MKRLNTEKHRITQKNQRANTEEPQKNHRKHTGKHQRNLRQITENHRKDTYVVAVAHEYAHAFAALAQTAGQAVSVFFWGDVFLR